MNTSHSLLPLTAQCFLLVSQQAMLDATHLLHVVQHLLQPLVLQQGVSKDCWKKINKIKIICHITSHVL